MICKAHEAENQMGKKRKFFGEWEVERGEAFSYLAKEFADRLIFRFHYSDNDGNLYSTMEHGQIFSKLPYIRFSHH